MNYRQKSKIHGKWAFIRQPGDMAIYAVCQNCGYTYPSYIVKSMKVYPRKPHKYCPNCGLKMGMFDNNIYKVDENGIVFDVIENKEVSYT